MLSCTVNASLIMCLSSPDLWSAFGIWLNTDFTSLIDAGLRNDISRTILKDVLNAWSRCPLLCWNFLKMLTFMCQVLIFVYIKRLHLFIALLFLFLLFIHKLQLDIFVSCMPCIILVHFYSLIPPSTLSMMHFFSLFIYLFIYTDRQIDTQTYCPFYFKLSVYFNVCHKGLDYV